MSVLECVSFLDMWTATSSESRDGTSHGLGRRGTPSESIGHVSAGETLLLSSSSLDSDGVLSDHDEPAGERPDIVFRPPPEFKLGSNGTFRRCADEVAKTRALQAQIRGLQAQVAQQEKEVTAMVRAYHGFDKEGSLLADLEGYEAAIAEEIDILDSGLQGIRTAMAGWQHARGIKKHDQEKTAALENGVKEKIDDFKAYQQQCLEKLACEETLLTREIQAYQQQFEAWAAAPEHRPALSSAMVGPPGMVTEAATDVPTEVAAFDIFLQRTGGLSGGWDAYDHNMFLKLRQQIHGGDRRVVTIADALPSKSIEDVEAHEQWYREMLRLRDSKVASIAAWKADVQQRKQAQQEAAEADKKALAENTARKEAQRKEREAAHRRETEATVQGWRKQKESDGHAQARLAEEEQQAVQRKLREQERRRQARAKAQVQAYQLKRDREQEVLAATAAAQAQAVQPRVKAVDLARFRRRDEQTLAEKRLREKEQQEAEEDKQRRLDRLRQQVQVSAQREPGRLTQPTAAVRNRMADSTTSSGRVIARFPPKLGIPSWRRGL